YDAVVLVIVLGWIANRWQQHPVTRVFVILCLVPFLVPGGTMMEVLQAQRLIVPAVASSWWWNLIMLPHQIWSLLVLGLTLLLTMIRPDHDWGTADSSADARHGLPEATRA